MSGKVESRTESRSGRRGGAGERGSGGEVRLEAGYALRFKTLFSSKESAILALNYGGRCHHGGVIQVDLLARAICDLKDSSKD